MRRFILSLFVLSVISGLLMIFMLPPKTHAASTGITAAIPCDVLNITYKWANMAEIDATLPNHKNNISRCNGSNYWVSGLTGQTIQFYDKNALQDYINNYVNNNSPTPNNNGVITVPIPDHFIQSGSTCGGDQSEIDTNILYADQYPTQTISPFWWFIPAVVGSINNSPTCFGYSANGTIDSNSSPIDNIITSKVSDPVVGNTNNFNYASSDYLLYNNSNTITVAGTSEVYKSDTGVPNDPNIYVRTDYGAPNCSPEIVVTQEGNKAVATFWWLSDQPHNLNNNGNGTLGDNPSTQSAQAVGCHMNSTTPSNEVNNNNQTISAQIFSIAQIQGSKVGTDGQINVKIPNIRYISPPSTATCTSAPSTPGCPSAINNSNNNSSGNSSSQSTTTCESSSFPLAWITCAVINEIAKIEQSIERIIGDLLNVQTFTYSTSTCQSGHATQCIYTVWNNFRKYADILLVIGLLVVIFAESIGGGLIDSYSIRKILPRILIAAILINLSIYIVGALVDVTNILGKGISSLILSPFGLSITLVPNGTTGTILGIGFVTLALGIIGGTITALATGKSKTFLDAIVGLLFMVGLPVLMAVLGVLVTIIFRIAIIYFLTIISPIAFALYVLPNTEQYFKKWWKVLMEALLVYPIVFIVFAMSKITGAIVSSISLPGIASVLAQILGIAATLAPLFLIPFAFKIAGNTIGTVHDAVTKGRQKLHGGIKGNAQDPTSLQNRIKKRFGMATNEMGISKGALFDQVGNAHRLLTSEGRKERRRRLSERSTMRGSALGSEFLDKDGIWQKNKNNDKFLLAHADRELAVARRNQAETDGDHQMVEAYDQAISAADMVTRNSSTMALSANQLASTGFGFSAGRKGYNELANMVAKHAGVNINDLDKDPVGNITGIREGAANAGIYQKMMNDNQFALRQAGRYDLGGINDGAGYSYDAGMDKSSGYTAGNAKGETWIAGAEEKFGIEKLSGNAVEDAKMLNTNWTEGKISVPEIDAYMSKLAESYQGATGGNKKLIIDQMNAIEEFARNPDPNLKHQGGMTLDYEKIKNLKNSAISGRGIDPNIINSK